MKLVYTHPSQLMVAHMRSAIERAGIECTLRNEYASGAIGELAPIDSWAEVWVVRDRDYDRARQVVEHLQQEVQEEDWDCTQCGKSSPATFEICWHCGTSR